MPFFIDQQTLDFCNVFKPLPITKASTEPTDCSYCTEKDCFKTLKVCGLVNKKLSKVTTGQSKREGVYSPFVLDRVYYNRKILGFRKKAQHLYREEE
jgi:hypothetical protein